jgi:hypothetical protein
VKRASFKHCDHKQTLGGKGDVRRPSDKDKYEDGWDRIFGKSKENTKEKDK